MLCFLRGTDWIFKYYLKELRPQRVISKYWMQAFRYARQRTMPYSPDSAHLPIPVMSRHVMSCPCVWRNLTAWFESARVWTCIHTRAHKSRANNKSGIPTSRCVVPDQTPQLLVLSPKVVPDMRTTMAALDISHPPVWSEEDCSERHTANFKQTTSYPVQAL